MLPRVSIAAAATCARAMQQQVVTLQQQVKEAEGEVQVLLGHLAVQSKLAIASSKELTHLHELIRKQENQHRLVCSHALYWFTTSLACLTRSNAHHHQNTHRHSHMRTGAAFGQYPQPSAHYCQCSLVDECKVLCAAS